MTTPIANSIVEFGIYLFIGMLPSSCSSCYIMFSCFLQLPFLLWMNFTAKATNSIANETNSVAKPMNSVAKATNSIANRTNSIAKLPNSIAKTCNTNTNDVGQWAWFHVSFQKARYVTCKWVWLCTYLTHRNYKWCDTFLI